MKRSAEQVGNIVAAWREMAMSFADTFASHSSGKQLRDSFKSSTVQVVDNRVLTSASVDSRTVVRCHQGSHRPRRWLSAGRCLPKGTKWRFATEWTGDVKKPCAWRRPLSQPIWPRATTVVRARGT